MKTVIKVSYVICCTFILLSLPRHLLATHAMGTDITYQWVSGETYEFTLTFYRDCLGSTAPSSVTLNINSPSACGSTASVTLSQNGAGVEVSPLCPTQLTNSTCNSGTLPGVQQYSYTGNYTFPTQCTDWNISWTHCCRNNMVTNLTTPGSFDMYVETTLDNSVGLNNSSPTFTSLPVPYICANQPFCYNHGALDPDGDSLVYSLVNALDGPYPGSNITYNVPHSGTYPVATVSGSSTFDPTTGSMCVTPNGPQVAVVTILVEEFRNGNRIGTTMRDLQIVVQACTNVQPAMNSGGMLNNIGGVVLDSNSIEVCPGDPVSFDLAFNDANGTDIITVTSNIAGAIPAATFSSSGSNPVSSTFSWTPSATDVGFHSFTVTIQDDGCPILGSQVFSFDIDVLDGTYAGPDLAYCPAGGPRTMAAAGGTIFNWTVLSGDAGSLTCNPCANQTVSPSVTTTYEVISNLSGTCKNRDTVVVSRVPDFPLSLSPAAPAICMNEIVTLTAGAGPTGGPFTYNWGPGNGLTSTSVMNPDASPLTTTEYFVSVTSAAGCTIEDSLTVTVTGIGPTVLPFPTDTNLCQGSGVQLDALAFIQPAITGPNPGGCTGSTANGIIGTDVSATGYIGPFNGLTTGTYLMRHQYLYTAAELQAAGFSQGGTITEIALDLEYAKALDFDNFTIRMGGTALANFANGNFLPSLDQVYFRGVHSLPNATGWHTITLDVPYDWDGSSNLIVEFCSDGTNDLDFNYVHYSSTSPNYYAIYDYSTIGLGCAETLGSRTTIRPNMQFTLCAPPLSSPSFSWSPGTDLSDPSIINPAASPSATTTYQLNVVDGVSGCTGSALVTVNVGPDFALATHPDSNICFGGSANLFATPNIGGSYTYAWSPSNGLSNSAVASPIATPGSTVDYAVEVSNGNCIKFDTITLSVAGTPIAAVVDQDTVCPGTTVQLDVSTAGILSDDFEGGIDMSMWSVINGGTANANCGTNAGVNALHFDGTTTTREATTVPLNTSSCTSVDFCLIIAGGTGSCENADLGEDVELNYSTDGGTTWIQLALYDEATHTSWTCISEPLPVAAQTSATLFQWNQVAYTSCVNCDNWALDDVNLSCAPVGGPFTYSWTPSTGLSNPNIANPTATVDANQYAYSVSVTDLSAPTCPSSANLNVVIDSAVFVGAVASDPTPCGGDNVQLNANMTGAPLPTSLSSCGINGTTLSQPPVTVQVGTGTSSSSTYSPFYGTYEDAKYQFLILASELQAAGVPSGTITQLSWNITTKNSTQPYDNFRISLACTGTSALSTAAWESQTLVYGPTDYSTTLGVNTFSVTGFDWDGISNLVVTTCYNNRNNDMPGGLDNCEYTAGLGFNAELREYSTANGTNGCNLAPAYAYTARPNIQFTVVPPPPTPFTYVWSPSTGLSDPTIANPVATFGTNITYTVAVAGGKCSVSDTLNLVACGTLPVDAMELSGAQDQAWVHLDWWTENEENSDYFLIQRSRDGNTFESIGEVMAAGAFQGRMTYDFTDKAPYSGLNYYRLKLMDQDGTDRLSNTISVLFDQQGNLLQLYPNPLQDQQPLIVDYYSNQAGNLKLTLYDLSGKSLLQEHRAIDKGRNQLQITFPGIAMGSYLLKVEDGSFSEVHPLMILK